MKIYNKLIEENQQHSALKNYDWKLHIIESDEGGAFFIPVSIFITLNKSYKYYCLFNQLNSTEIY